tara:strand:+ start:838 stop:1023 length:186 start_codon:yes stop_codon:yes gene_type:complete
MSEGTEARLWRNHPGLHGQTGIGVEDGNGRTVWYTPQRAREVIAQLEAGLSAAAQKPGDPS